MAYEASTPILSIFKMIQSLSELHSNLSAALQKRFPKPSASAEEEEEEEAAAKDEEIKPEPEIKVSDEEAQVEKLLSDIKHLKEALETTKELDRKLNVPIRNIQTSLDKVLKDIMESRRTDDKFLGAISKDLKTLRFQIPSYQKLSLAGTTAAHLFGRGSGGPRQSEFKLPNLYGHKVFDESPAFEEIKEIYNRLSTDVCKNCFLYFAVFPENVVLKKRFLTHWWIGEGLLDPTLEDPIPEAHAGEILKEFAEKGLIVPVKEEHKKVKKRFTMPPIVRSAAIKLAIEKNFLDYDSGDNPKSSGCDRIFLVKGGGSQPPKAPTATTTTDQKLEEKVKTIFNVSQPFPDSAMEWLAKKGEVDMRTVKAVEWLLKLRNLQVLYLGRWQSAVDEQQIEVESLEFLKGLKNMKKLRLLSLQGISWINKLPNSIRTLSELRVLDLKSCFNLEKLPQGVGSLNRLTHLDVSGCYMLNHMPKSISKLTELRVLKGFVTGMSNLNTLKGLKKLRKLSINTSRQDFPNKADLRILQDLGEHGKLRNLAIVWGAEGVKQQSSDGLNMIRQITKQFSKQRNQSDDVNLLELPEELEKLEMECLPKEWLPQWLNPSKLKSLKRLYIRGGKLAELGDTSWSAEVVRLKYMTALKIDWRELQKSFPNLSYLQRVRCPRVTFCPCDANGVWMKP